MSPGASLNQTVSTQVTPTRPANRPDARSAAEKREGRKRYGKAHAYYGKTYIVTRKQLVSGIVLALGVVLASSGGLFLVYLKVIQSAITPE